MVKQLEMCFPSNHREKKQQDGHLGFYPACFSSPIFFVTGNSLLAMDSLMHTSAKQPGLGG